MGSARFAGALVVAGALMGDARGQAAVTPQQTSVPTVWVWGVPEGLTPPEIELLGEALREQVTTWQPDLLVVEELLAPESAPEEGLRPWEQPAKSDEPGWVSAARQGEWTRAALECDLSGRERERLGVPSLEPTQRLALQLARAIPDLELRSVGPRSGRFDQLWDRAQVKAKDLALISTRHARGSAAWVEAEQRFDDLFAQLPVSYEALVAEYGEDSRAAEVFAAFRSSLHPRPPESASLLERFTFWQHPERVAVQRRRLRGVIALVATEGLGIELLAAAERAAVEFGERTIPIARKAQANRLLVFVAHSRLATTRDAFQRHGFELHDG